MRRLNDSEDDDDFRPSEDQLGMEREVFAGGRRKTCTVEEGTPRRGYEERY